MAMKLCGFLLAVVAIAAFQVEHTGSFSRSSMYLDPKHPGVYLTLEKKGPRKPHFPTESKTGVWLRFHNNMRDPVILLNADYAVEELTSTVYENGVHFLKDGAEVGACYTVEAFLQREAAKPPESMPGALWGGMGELFHAPVPEQSERDSCYSKPALRGADIGNDFVLLAPGTSAVFSVPENFVSSGLRISTEFSYAWESPTHGPDDISDVVHYVRYGVYPLEPSSKVIDPKTGDLHLQIPVAARANAK
jgi:hypothetical protein